MRNRRQRRGQALVEFAVVALVLYLMLAAIITFGHAIYVAQGLQGAADLAAREISRTPLPANTAFETLMNDGSLESVYSEDFLVYDLGSLGNQNFFQDVVPTWPTLNQQLAGLMIVDGNFIRYPGALLEAPGTPTGFTVGIPLVTSRDGGGETIRWVPVIEEIDSESNPDPFQVSSASRGLVAIRINYPFQSAAMSSYRPNSAGPFEPTIGQPNLANDGNVDELNTAPGDLTGAPLNVGETYGGQYGLGAQAALGQNVRPFRRVISAQAIYRREIFQ